MTNAPDDGGPLPRRVYLDTQFLFAYFVDGDRDHEAAVTTAEGLRVVHGAGHITAFVSVLVLNELAWKLAGAFFDREHGEGAWNRSDKQRANESVRAQVAEAIQGLIRLPWLRIASADEEACSMFPVFMHRYPLCPADLAHLVVASTSGMDAIMTHDKHFHALEDGPVPIVAYRRGE